ncbi:MAG: hypothetical protein GWN87_24895 [Desulfuromonadales bacterium]|nr:hypothetical protein [Desulfuromonadales bacterium]
MILDNERPPVALTGEGYNHNLGPRKLGGVPERPVRARSLFRARDLAPGFHPSAGEHLPGFGPHTGRQSRLTFSSSPLPELLFDPPGKPGPPNCPDARLNVSQWGVAPLQVGPERRPGEPGVSDGHLTLDDPKGLAPRREGELVYHVSRCESELFRGLLEKLFQAPEIDHFQTEFKTRHVVTSSS